MPRTCTVCTHPNRTDIDTALVSGESYRNIATRFGTSTGALLRHKTEHIPAHLARAEEAKEMGQANDLLTKIMHIEAEARRMARKAEDMGDLRTAMSGIRELARLVELLAKLRGELQDNTTVNVLVLPEWQRVREVILEALLPFPHARIAVANALERMNSVASA